MRLQITRFQMRCPVVNIHKKYKSDVYIGRGSIWGNPFKIGPDGSRSDVIRKHRDWILNNPILLFRIPQLHDKVLGCFCKPKGCHGDTLADLVEASKFINLTTGVLHEEVVQILSPD